jgi:tripartite-type tricarboxylate transporter receptor subunit TctC
MGASRSLPAIILFAAAAAAPLTASSQAYPSKPIRVLVPFSAGSIPDLVARVVGEKISPALGQPVISENRIGAGGRIAAEAAAKAPADGYNLLLGSASTHVVSPYVVKNLRYDPIKDFTPIANAAAPGSALVINSSLPVNSVGELLEYARRNPGKIAYGSNGIGSTHHLRGEMIKLAGGVDMLHVPFGGSNELFAGLISDQVQLSFFGPAPVAQHMQAGKVKLLAFVTPKRSPFMPNVPTLTEELPGYQAITDWFAFFGPAGLARPIVVRLNAEILKALDAADVQARLATQSLITIPGSPEELAAQMKSESLAIAKVVKAAGVQPE